MFDGRFIHQVRVVDGFAHGRIEDLLFYLRVNLQFVANLFDDCRFIFLTAVFFEVVRSRKTASLPFYGPP
jgi:hypothetical protein